MALCEAHVRFRGRYWGVKRTSLIALHMSAFDPKRTFYARFMPFGPINPYIAAEINSSNSTTLSSVSDLDAHRDPNIKFALYPKEPIGHSDVWSNV